MDLDNMAVPTAEVAVDVPVVRCVNGGWVERRVTALDHRKIPVTRTVRVYRAFSNYPKFHNQEATR